jgi:hypothetical protein
MDALECESEKVRRDPMRYPGEEAFPLACPFVSLSLPPASLLPLFSFRLLSAVLYSVRQYYNPLSYVFYSACRCTRLSALPTIRTALNANSTTDYLLCSTLQGNTTTDYPMCSSLRADIALDYPLYRLSPVQPTILCALLCVPILHSTIRYTDYPLSSACR